VQDHVARNQVSLALGQRTLLWLGSQSKLARMRARKDNYAFR
jgi:hypothetical protein